MSHNQNPSSMIDDVPVKISERFKPPPKISIPQSVIQKLNGSKEFGQNADYDFSLERNVLLKISEWKAVREREKNESQERLRLSEERRMRLLEQKQKKMLNDVSYPSTEDLSIEYDIPEEHHTEISQPQKFTTNSVNFDTILTPTIVPRRNSNQTDSLSATRYNVSNYQRTHTRNNSLNNKNKINYSDFENDTSSPFDNMELKTINDLAILAQVLNNTISIDSKTDDNIRIEMANTSPQEMTMTEINLTETNDNNIIIENSIEDMASAISPPQKTQNIPIEQGNHHSNHNPIIHNYYNGKFENNIYHQYHIENQQQPNFNLQSSLPAASVNYMDYHNTYNTYNPINFQTNLTTYEIIPEQNTNNVKSKSKSVPDILKELNDNINDSEMRRIRNNSQTIQSEFFFKLCKYPYLKFHSITRV